MKVVFNTSPLIFLTRLEMLEPFLVQVRESSAPQAVLAEIQAKDDNACHSLMTIFARQQIKIKSINNFTLANSLNKRLGRGESDAITLALELNADYVVLDDFAARREASRLGLPVKGTLGIIKKLQQDGKITINSLDVFYLKLTAIGFRIKRSIFDQIFLDF